MEAYEILARNTHCYDKEAWTIKTWEKAPDTRTAGHNSLEMKQ